MNTSEILIPVPWGHIAAKSWGDSKDPHVLVFHGVLDNAGSFDGLIPLLPTCFYYIVVDLPGHGKSSHFPPFLLIYSFNYVIVYKMLADYFQQENYVVMGHSYGGQIGLLFTQLYPELVKKLILLESISFYSVSVKGFKDTLRFRIDACLHLEKKLKVRQPPSYTYEEALDRIRVQRASEITMNTAENLLSRGLIGPNEEGKYSYSFDQRIKLFTNPLYDVRFTCDLLQQYPVQCPFLMILAKENFVQRTVLKQPLKVLKTRKNFKLKLVDGNHDVHSNAPETVAPIIEKFLLDTKHKL